MKRTKLLVIAVLLISGLITGLYLILNKTSTSALSPGDDVSGQFGCGYVDEYGTCYQAYVGDWGGEWTEESGYLHTYFRVSLAIPDGSFLKNYQEVFLHDDWAWECGTHGAARGGNRWATLQYAKVNRIESNWIYVDVRLSQGNNLQDVAGTIKIATFVAGFRSQSTVGAWLPTQDRSQGQWSTSDYDNVTEGTRSGAVSINTNIGERDRGNAVLSFSHDVFRIGDEGGGRWAHANWNKGSTLNPYDPMWGNAWLQPWQRISVGENVYDNIQVSLGQKQTYCQAIAHDRTVLTSYAPGDPQIEVWDRGESNACATVAHPYNFQLNDAIKLEGENVVYTGQTAEAGYYLYNRDEDKPRTDIAHTASPTDTKTRKIWFLTNELDANKLQGGIEQTDDEASICNHFSGQGVAWDSNYGCNTNQLKADESIQPDESHGGPTTGNTAFNVPDIDPASGMNKFCVATAVNPSSSKSDGDGTEVNHEWVVSNASCRTIAKKPLIDFKMGNVYSAGGIKTSISTKTNNITYGAWAEYLAISNNDISHFASGAQIAGGSTLGPDICNYAPLSIANVQCQKSAAAGAVGQSNAKNEGKFLNQIMGLYENEGADIHSTDEWGPNIYIIHPQNGDFEIKNDIIVNGAYERASDVPQYIIIAENIKIDPNVTRVDAWLIATGTKKDGQYLGGRIETCAGSEVGPMNIDNCAADLQINGPILAKNMTTNRTAGAGTMASGTSAWPAEILNLTPAAYEWAYSQASGSEQSQSHTVYTRELAPRL